MKEMLQYISDYGTTTILAAMFLYIILKQQEAKLKSDKKREELEGREQENNRRQSDKLTNAAIESAMLKIKKSKEELKKADVSIGQIDKLLSQFIEEHSCDRISIMSYHNGTIDLMGNHFSKISCTNQKVRPGISASHDTYKNLFKAFFHTITSVVDTKGEYYLEDVETIRETDYGLYNIFVSGGLKGMYAESLHGLCDDTVIGMLTITFIRELDITEEEKKQTKLDLKRLALKIDGVLSI